MTEPFLTRIRELASAGEARPVLCRQLLRSLLADAERAALCDLGLVAERLEAAQRLLSDAGVGDRADPSVRGGLAAWQVRKLERHIVDNLADSIRIADLAQLAGLSAGHFGRAFKISFGCSPHAYVLQARVAKAKAILLELDRPLSQVALDCGFCDQAHFSRLFRRIVGAPPYAWRRSHQAMIAA